jgi:hypothetical protein
MIHAERIIAMKNNVTYEKLLHQLAQIPHNMISNHHKHNITEFVLHDLCSSNCFNITKAAYLVNNKDFKCLRGIAGFYQPEAFLHEGSIWHNSEKFSSHMKNAPFNKKVRALDKENLSTDDSHHKLMQAVAKDLELQDPEFWTANLKYDNVGILIYQKPQNSELTDYLKHGFSFLGLCPLF